MLIAPAPVNNLYKRTLLKILISWRLAATCLRRIGFLSYLHNYITRSKTQSITQSKFHIGMRHKGVTQRCCPELLPGPDIKKEILQENNRQHHKSAARCFVSCLFILQTLLFFFHYLFRQ